MLVATSVALAGCDDKSSNGADADAGQPVTSQDVSVEVGAMGYTPSEVYAKAGEKLKLTFTRTSDEGCGEKLVFPDHGIEKDLPLNERVVVELTPQANENIGFTCGMGMYKGSIVAKN